jgi:hypothetical protein
MKKLIVILSLLFVVVFPSVVSYAQVPRFKCYAASYHAWGVGFGPTSNIAGDIAIRECASRTPYYDTCFLKWCIRVE